MEQPPETRLLFYSPGVELERLAKGCFSVPAEVAVTPGHFITSIRKFLHGTTKVCTSETGDWKISGLASVTGGGGGKPGRDVRALQLENDTMRLPGGSRRGLNINSHPYEYKKINPSL